MKDKKSLLLLSVYITFAIASSTKGIGAETTTIAAETIDNKFINAGPEETCSGDYEESNGLIVIQAENLKVSGTNWQIRREKTGFTGLAYIGWFGNNAFNAPGNGVLTAKVKITKTGRYRFQWRSKVGEGNSSTDFNDSWLRFPDASAFYAEKNGNKVYPKGSGLTPVPEGSGADGWFKVYSSGTTSWTWSTFTFDNNPHQIYVEFDTPGEYTMEISGRSKNHLLDRVSLFQTGADGTNTSNMETVCMSASKVLATGVTIAKQNGALVEGESLGLLQIVSPSNATNPSVNWSSNKPAVAMVDSNGQVMAISKGTAIITVTTVDGSLTDVFTITVSPPPVDVTGVELQSISAPLSPKETAQLVATISPGDATNKKLVWSSSNKLVATVNSSGLVTAVSEGTTIITVTTDDGGFEGSSEVTVFVPIVSATGVEILPNSQSLLPRESFQLLATVSPSDATNINLSWNSNNESVATVSLNGLVTAVAEGSALITVTTEDGDFTDTSILTVLPDINTGSEEIINEVKKSKIYPNPVSIGGDFNLDLASDNANKNVIVFDAKGLQLFEIKPIKDKQVLSTRTFPTKGLYFIRIADENKIEILKLLVK